MLELAATTMTPIEFAILTPNLTPGGAERHCISLAHHGPAVGMYCNGVAVSGAGGIDRDMAAELSCFSPISSSATRESRRRDLGHVSLPARSIRESVHLVCREARVLITWGSAEMARFTDGLGIPVVCVSHCSVPDRRPVNGVTHLVGVSRASLAFFDNTAAEVPRTVIHNGVEVHRVTPRFGRAWQRREWGFGDGDVVVGNLGRQSREKDPELLIRALAHLPSHYKAVYYGAHPADPSRPCPSLVELAYTLGVADRVQFHLPQPFLGDVLAGLDVFTLLSHREANSLGLLEAFLAGVPAVATPVGALPELEEAHGVLCVRAESREPADVAADVVWASLPRHRDEMARRARLVAEAHWTAPAMLKRWRTYLESVLSPSEACHAR